MNSLITFSSLGLTLDFVNMESYPEYLYLTPETKHKLRSLIVYDIDFEIEYIFINDLIFPISRSPSFDVIGKKGLKKLKNFKKIGENVNRIRI